MMYALEGDRVMFVPPVLAQQVRELGIRAGEIFEICKAELCEESKRRIEWRVKKIEQARHPASSGNVSEAAASVPNNDAQNHRNGNTDHRPRPLDLQASADGTLLPVPVTGAGITAMDVGHERGGGSRAAGRVSCADAQRLAAVHHRGYPGDRPNHVHSGHAGARCHMGSALRTGLTSAPLVQLAFPGLRELPLLAPPPESTCTELIVAPEVALTKLPATKWRPRRHDRSGAGAVAEPDALLLRLPGALVVQVRIAIAGTEEQFARFGPGRAPG